MLFISTVVPIAATAMTSYIYFLVAVLLLTLGVIVSSWEALDPEQVLFGFSRCGEDFTPNDANRETRIRNWAVWKLEPRDNWTMCYVRCCLERLELFDLNTNKFMSERVDVQFNAYKQFNGLSGATVKDFKNALKVLPQLDSCEAVFTTLLTKLGSYVPTIVKLYHGSPSITKPIYEAKAKSIRQKKQPYTEYCENKYYPRGDKVLCDFRKTGTTKESGFKEVINCIFKGFRYLDKNGNIIPDEIIRDFYEINQKQLDAQVRQVISNCQVNEKTKAYDYYECLRRDRRLQGQFRPAFEYREVRSADYDYAFQIPGPPVYDVTVVRKEVDLITSKQCSKA